MIGSIHIREQFRFKLFIIFSFIHLIRFTIDNVRVFQRVFMNLSMNIGQAVRQLQCHHTQSTLAASCVW